MIRWAITRGVRGVRGVRGCQGQLGLMKHTVTTVYTRFLARWFIVVFCIIMMFILHFKVDPVHCILSSV